MFSSSHESNIPINNSTPEALSVSALLVHSQQPRALPICRPALLTKQKTATLSYSHYSTQEPSCQTIPNTEGFSKKPSIKCSVKEHIDAEGSALKPQLHGMHPSRSAYLACHRLQVRIPPKRRSPAENTSQRHVACMVW